jgi:Ala-tRNA(Pro) deacylase
MSTLYFFRINTPLTRLKFGALDMTEIPKRLIDYLNDNRVQYEVFHQPAVATDSSAKTRKSGSARFHAKVVMVKAGHQHLLTVVPQGTTVDLDRLGEFVGEAVRLDTAEEFKWLFPDCVTDAIPPFGNLYGLPTFADTELSKNGYIVFPAGTPNDYIKLSYSAYDRIVQPQVGAFSVKIRSRHSE